MCLSGGEMALLWERLGGDAGVCLGKEFGAQECKRFQYPARNLPWMVASG